MFARLRWPAAQRTGRPLASNAWSSREATHRRCRGAGRGAGRADRHEPLPLVLEQGLVLASRRPTTSPLWGVDLTLRYSVVLTADASRQRPDGDPSQAPNLPAAGCADHRRADEERARGRASTSSTNSLRCGRRHSLSTRRPSRRSRRRHGGRHRAVTPRSRSRFDGPRGTAAGMVWVVPVLTLRRFTRRASSEVDAHGQVVATAPSRSPFPVVEARAGAGPGLAQR